jgi:Tfp pilus assembly ATPase PilU
LAEAAELYLPDEILIPFCKKIREDNYLSLFLPDIKMQRKLKRRYARLKKEAPELKNIDHTDYVKAGKVLELKRIELELSRLGENTQNQKLYQVLSMMKRYEDAARLNRDTPVAKEYYQLIKPAIQKYIDSCKDEIAWS